MRSGLFQLDPPGGSTFNHISVRCGELYNIVDAVGQIIKRPNAVGGAELSDLFLCVVVLHPVQRVFAAVQQIGLVDAAGVLPEGERACAGVRLVFHGNYSTAAVVVCAVDGNDGYLTGSGVLFDHHRNVLRGSIAAVIGHSLFERISMCTVCKITRADVQGKGSAIAHFPAVGHRLISVIEREYCALADLNRIARGILEPALVYGQLCHAADKDRVAHSVGGLLAVIQLVISAIYYIYSEINNILTGRNSPFTVFGNVDYLRVIAVLHKLEGRPFRNDHLAVIKAEARRKGVYADDFPVVI